MTAAQEGVGGQQHAPAALYTQERHGNQFTRGWVGPMAGVGLQNNSSAPGYDPGPSSSYSVSMPTELTDPLYINMYYTHTGLLEMKVGVLQFVITSSQVSFILYRCSICAPFVILQTSTR